VSHSADRPLRTWREARRQHSVPKSVRPPLRRRARHKRWRSSEDQAIAHEPRLGHALKQPETGGRGCAGNRLDRNYVDGNGGSQACGHPKLEIGPIRKRKGSAPSAKRDESHMRPGFKSSWTKQSSLDIIPTPLRRSGIVQRVVSGGLSDRPLKYSPGFLREALRVKFYSFGCDPRATIISKS
jgi:hypothetical protein